MKVRTLRGYNYSQSTDHLLPAFCKTTIPRRPIQDKTMNILPW